MQRRGDRASLLGMIRGDRSVRCRGRRVYTLLHVAANFARACLSILPQTATATGCLLVSAWRSSRMFSPAGWRPLPNAPPPARTASAWAELSCHRYRRGRWSASPRVWLARHQPLQPLHCVVPQPDRPQRPEGRPRRYAAQLPSEPGGGRQPRRDGGLIEPPRVAQMGAVGDEGDSAHRAGICRRGHPARTIGAGEQLAPPGEQQLGARIRRPECGTGCRHSVRRAPAPASARDYPASRVPCAATGRSAGASRAPCRAGVRRIRSPGSTSMSRSRTARHPRRGVVLGQCGIEIGLDLRIRSSAVPGGMCRRAAASSEPSRRPSRVMTDALIRDGHVRTQAHSAACCASVTSRAASAPRTLAMSS